MGENPQRPLPEFVRTQVRDVLFTYRTPAFAVDRKKKGVRPWATVLRALAQVPRYWAVAPEIHRRIREVRPDLILNFYDLLGGLYVSLFRPEIPVVAVGHQFLFFHPEFPLGGERWWEVEGVRWTTLLTALGARVCLALSFTPLPDLPRSRIRVVPPLLRNAVLTADARTEEHILAYVLNAGYAEDLDRWHRDHSDVELHCFWDRTDVPAATSPREGLTFHRLDDALFLDLLAGCRGYTSTAGFESVCEAAYLMKPIMLVPTGNHVEQRCNARDAERAGIARWRGDFDLTDLLVGMESFDPGPSRAFRDWAQMAADHVLSILEATARRENPGRMTARAGRGRDPNRGP
jgi:uncharacterized protein (TIGR00661 family)